MKHLISYSLLIVILSTLIADSAYAYIDAGTGSMMAQLLVAGCAGISVAMRMYFSRIIAKLKRKRA